MVEWISDVVSNLTNPSVFVDWKPFGVVTGINSKSGVFNDEPLYNLLTDIYQEKGGEMYRRFVVSCVDANTGAYITFNETSPDIPMSSVSSSSIPGVFPDRIWPDYDGGIVCMDGGAVWNINVASAV